MKKTAAILFSVFYFLATIGIAISLHYCHGELESVVLYSNIEKNCCEHKGNSAGCCSNEQYLLQYYDEQQIIENPGNIIEQSIAVIAELILFSDNRDFEQEETVTEYSEPPPKQIQPVWLINCSLTYYG
ncbi:MAG: hypothetical protein JW894_01880 [Bacteroidales bacterium]|nr:hypothetical protein [Bacteroidales bacterium]